MKTVVITGASKGLGRVMVDLFSKEGWHVVGTGRSERPTDLREEIVYHQFDASDAGACADFWEKLSNSEVGGPICLVNNAGGYISEGLVGSDADDYRTQMDSNYFSSVYMTKGLVEAFDKARIINIISSGALAPHAWQSAYGASKAAAMHFFQTIRQELPAEKYRITNVYPSYIATRRPSDKAIAPGDLAQFVLQQSQLASSYYLPEVTIHPSK